MSDTPIPSPEQLQSARSERWHQTGEGLFTVEALRPWLHRFGLVLFAPRPQQLAVPAPTVVEAVAGTANGTPALPERQTARDLVHRLVVEGTAIPLNLLGSPGTTADEPDFVASAAALPYLFTLRGDKGWKQLPSTEGAFKVSPLAVNTYTMLSESGPRSAADLASELGKGLTEAAVLRALNELWQHLRVLPVREPGGRTLWEPLTARFSKAVKAGANAGQPSALSALISLYLEQAMLATETETETFLSPLAPRSRIRDVIHALRAAGELQEIVIAGKHCLHLPDGLPQFQAVAEPADAEAPPETAAAAEEVAITGEGGSRIKRFVAPPKKVGTGFKQRPKPFGGDRDRRPFQREGGAPRSGDRTDRRPGGIAGKPGPGNFSKPWEEERQERQSRPARPERPGSPDRPARPDRPSRPDRPGRPERLGRPNQPDRQRPERASGEGRPFSRDEAAGSSGQRPPRTGRPGFGSASQTEGGSRPAFSRGPRAPGGADSRGRSDRGARPRDVSETRRQGGAAERPPFGSDRAPRDRGLGAEPPPFRPRRDAGEGSGAPPRREKGPGAGKRPFDRREGGADRQDGGAPRRRPDAARGGDRPPYRRFDAPAGGDRPRKGASGRPQRLFGELAAGADRPRTPRPGVPDRGSARPPRTFSGPPSRGAGARPARGGSAPNRGGDRPPSDRPGARKPFVKRSPSGAGPRGETGPPAGPFDKFRGGAKPWGKRPPARRIKPEEDQA